MARPKKIDSTAEVQSAPSATDVAALVAQNEELLKQNAALIAALVASRESGKSAPAAESDEEQVRIENLLGTILAFTVTDPRTGLTRNIVLDRRGAFTMVLPAQVEEISEKYPHFFRDGYLGCPSVAPSPNTIPNFAKFCDSLEPEQIADRIGQITSVAVLYDLFNFIENQRFTHLDEQGNPLTEKDGDKAYLVMKETALPFKLASIERAVQLRLSELTGVRIALDI